VHCFHAREPAFTTKTIFWVDCERCGAWVHSYCAFKIKTTVFHVNIPVNCALVLSDLLTWLCTCVKYNVVSFSVIFMHMYLSHVFVQVLGFEFHYCNPERTNSTSKQQVSKETCSNGPAALSHRRCPLPRPDRWLLDGGCPRITSLLFSGHQRKAKIYRQLRKNYWWHRKKITNTINVMYAFTLTLQWLLTAIPSFFTLQENTEWLYKILLTIYTHFTTSCNWDCKIKAKSMHFFQYNVFAHSQIYIACNLSWWVWPIATRYAVCCAARWARPAGHIHLIWYVGGWGREYYAII